MKPKSCKGKGRTLQHWVRDEILKQFPQLTVNDVKSTIMGESGPDVQLSEKGYDLFPFVIECKKYQKFSVYTHYEQAQRHNKEVNKTRTNTILEPRRMPTKSLLIIEGNYKEPLAVVDAQLFIQLAQMAMAYIKDVEDE